MRIARAIVFIALLSAAFNAQVTQTAQRPTQKPIVQTAELPASGMIAGLVTAATGETVTVTAEVNGKPAVRTFRISPNTTVFAMPARQGSPTKMIYKDAAGGGLKELSWFGDASLVGKAVELEAKDGSAFAARFYAACTRERCESPACRKKCKASTCACPAEK